MPTKHFKYGGSTAARTMQCPAWQLLKQDMPQKPSGSSPDADRGTLLHDCMELLLRDPDMPVEALLGKEYNGHVVTEDELEDAIKPALNAYIDFAEERKFDYELPEMEVVYSHEDDVGGTSDVIAANSDTVFIIDWKFGYNPVSATENAQGLFYAMCARQDPNTRGIFDNKTKLCIVIIQPQSPHAILSAWDTDLERLNTFEAEYTQAIMRENKDTPITGEYCKFCPAMAICPAKTGAARKALMLDPKSAHAKELGNMLRLADEVEEWAKEIKKFAHEQAELGLQIDGFKLVDKRATRKWRDESEVLEVIKKSRSIKLDEATDTKLKSPAQLEKICKKKGVDFELYNTYIESISSGTTLTTADDKRPAAFNMSAFTAAINATE